MVEYKLKDNKILKDGHTMFLEDAVLDLNRKSYLESKREELKELYINIDSFNYQQIQDKIKEILLS